MFRNIALAALLGLAAAQAPAPQISIAEPAFTPLDIPLSQLAKTVTGNQPEQIKIAVAGSGGISLSWLTGQPAHVHEQRPSACCIDCQRPLHCTPAAAGMVKILIFRTHHCQDV